MKLCLMAWFMLAFGFAYAQNEKPADTTARELDEVVVSFNKWEQNLNEIPNKISKISRRDIIRNNPQTAADMLAQSGSVFVQKSQLGGGSPMIRGFATNRVLLVVDGVRMNNAIYRSGNLQNVISLDAQSIETAEVIFGPGSLIYGSDAIGGVMDFHTMAPRFSNDGKILVKGSAMARYSSANREQTYHADLVMGWKKWSVVSAATFSSFNNLKMGNHGGQARYLRPEYVKRVNGIDETIKNSDARVQRFSGYDQWNVLQKLAFQPKAGLSFQYSFLYGGTGEAPRYDRLIQYRNGSLRFAEWNYGPMLWRMHSLQMVHQRPNFLYDESKLVVAYQDYAESRIDRTRNRTARNRQEESVNAISLNWDANKKLGKGVLFYGSEYVFNKVGSTGNTTNIETGNISPLVSRYPDGSTWGSGAVYGSYKINLQENFTFTGGLRYSRNKLTASFNQDFLPFPFESANINEGALTGNAGLVYRAQSGWKFNANFSTGYRMPNIDDIGKVFESAPGNITVPNPDLESEYAWNFELGFVKEIQDKIKIELTGFYTVLNNAIVRRPFRFNGRDSIIFDGDLSRVESLQNTAKATVWGLQAATEITLSKSVKWRTMGNWTKGKETDEIRDEQVPLRHAPPFYGSTCLRLIKGKWDAEISVVYNSEISNRNLAPSEQAKPEIYAIDASGKPYSPSWYTLNTKISYRLNSHLQLNTGWENLTNQRYRTYSSGIVAPGSNFILSFRASL